jgi:hypothetical protein
VSARDGFAGARTPREADEKNSKYLKKTLENFIEKVHITTGRRNGHFAR